MHKSMLILIAALILTACGLGVQQTPEPPPKPKRLPPAYLTQDCGDLPQPLTEFNPALLKNHVQVAARYHLCRGWHLELVKWHEVNSD